MITIVSLDNKSIQLSNKIIQLAKGLEPFDQNQDIIYQEIVTGDFLETFKLFYEEYQFDIEKMKFQKPLQTKELEKCFTKNLADKIKPFIDIAIREKNFDIFIQFIQGAHLLQANHFIDFINCCLASAIQFKGSSDYDIKQFQKDWNLSDQQMESSFNQIFIQKLQNKYIQVLSTKEGDQPVQIQNQFEEDFLGGSDEW